MSLRNSYQFLKDYCGTYVMKQSIIDLKDTIVEQGKADTSTMNLQGGGPNYSGPVNGRLYRNTYIPYCLCGIPYCCIRNTYELDGYNQKLSETTIPSNCCTCTPQYPVTDGQEKALGHLKNNCIGIFIPCCLELQVTSFNRPQTYTIPRPCCTVPCCRRWEVKDANGTLAAEITFDGGLLLLKQQYQVNFFGNLSNQDRALFLSTIPFLP